MTTNDFAGFSRPQDSFYRLPNDWFDILAEVRTAAERRRITSLVRLLEYIIKWTWGRLDFTSYIRLTFDELQHGKVIGRSGRQRARADKGTGLPRSGLNAAIQDALAYGLLERATDDRDAARVRQAYRVRLRPAADEAPADAPAAPFPGFHLPQSNYFIVPKIWTDLISNEGSDTLILAVEYFFRHCWGWRQADEAHWLTADEVAQGRIYRHSVSQGATRRYDRGIGYTVDATRRALDLGVERGWLSRKIGAAPSGWDAHLYTLRRFGWPAGDVAQEVVQGDSDSVPDVSVPYDDLYEPYSRESGLPEPESDSFAPPDDLNEPVADAFAPRTVLPTVNNHRGGKTLPTPTRHPPKQASSASHGGGDATMSPQGARTVFITLPHQRRIQEVTGRLWLAGSVLGPNEVVLRAMAADNGDAPAVVISLAVAAELLAGGMAPEQLGWDGDPADVVAEKQARVGQLWRVAERSHRLWGAASLQAALEQQGVARSTAAAWIARWGADRVGGWLQALRDNGSVRSLPALLYTRLKAGDPPPLVRE